MSKILKYYKDNFNKNKSELNDKIENLFLVKLDLDKKQKELNHIMLEKQLYKQMFDFEKCDTEEAKITIYKELEKMCEKIMLLKNSINILSEEESKLQKEIQYIYLDLKISFDKYTNIEYMIDYFRDE